MRYLLLFLVLISISINASLALTLDTSVDSELKKKYDYNKLNEEVLPQLPSHLKNNQKQTNTQTQKNTATKPKQTVVQNIVNSVKNNFDIKIPSGTKFYAKSNIKLSSWNKKDTPISFTTVAPVYNTFITIPTGSVLKGVVAVSHGAQITGNGGLLELKITSLTYNGKTIPVEGKITKVNSKNIFFNRIKGKRQYITGIENKIKQGNNFYQKTKNIASKMQKNSVGTVLSPIPILTGWAGTALMTAASPITGLVQKGQNVTIPQGTEFEIKLTADAYIN